MNRTGDKVNNNNNKNNNNNNKPSPQQKQCRPLWFRGLPLPSVSDWAPVGGASAVIQAMWPTHSHHSAVTPTAAPGRTFPAAQRRPRPRSAPGPNNGMLVVFVGSPLTRTPPRKHTPKYN